MLNLVRRLMSLFTPGSNGNQPALAGDPRYGNDIQWQQPLWFQEYCHGGTGTGPGAIHQTGWAALVCRLVEESIGGEFLGGARALRGMTLHCA